MQCPSCGVDNPDGKVFCVACGSAMIVKTGPSTTQHQTGPLPPPPAPPGGVVPSQAASQQPHPSTRPSIAAPGSWPRASQTQPQPQTQPQAQSQAQPQAQFQPQTAPKPTLNTAGKVAAPPPKSGLSSTSSNPAGPGSGSLPTPPPPGSTVSTKGSSKAGTGSGAAGSDAGGWIVLLLLLAAIVVGILWATGVIFKSQPPRGNGQLDIQQARPPLGSPTIHQATPGIVPYTSGTPPYWGGAFAGEIKMSAQGRSF